jgi:hypothetical protein
MAIPKREAKDAQEQAAIAGEVQEIEALLDAKITETGGKDVNVWKKEWASKPPSDAVIAALKAKFEGHGMGWELSVQPDRDGPIIWLK